MPALVNVEVALPRTVRMLPMSAVEEALSAPSMVRLLAIVEEAEEMRQNIESALRPIDEEFG